MKKLLLGTTALVAAGAFAVAAQADEMMAEPVSVGVGGYTTGAFGIASDGDDNTRSQEISYVYEIGVSGSTTLDNGITVAVSGQIGPVGRCRRRHGRDPHDPQRVVRFCPARKD